MITNMKPFKNRSIKNLFPEGNRPFALSLRVKFIISFFLLLLLPFISFTLIIYKTSETTIRDNSLARALKGVSRINAETDYYLNGIKSSIDMIFAGNIVTDYLEELSMPPLSGKPELESKSVDGSGSQLVLANVIYMMVGKISNIYYYDRNIYFIHPINTYYKDKNKDTSQAWYRDTLYAPETYNYFRNGDSICMTRSFQAKNSLMYFELGKDHLFENMNVDNEEFYSGSNLFVYDKYGKMIYSNPVANEVQAPDFLESVPGSGTGTISGNWNGKDYYVSYSISELSSWKFINAIPVDEVLKDLRTVKNTVIILTFVFLIIILVFSSAVSSVLLKPIHKIISAMKEVKEGDFSARVNIKNRDETKLLADSFNQMTTHLEYMINKVYTAELKQKEAELLSLQSQINPHFLYNTLESIRGAAILKGMMEIAEMSKRLSQMLRYSIGDVALVSISEELGHLENYIAIQNFRHNGKFQLILDIPEDIRRYSILRLTLQPLVENAIKHGLEMKMETGIIRVSFCIQGSDIFGQIWDNGIGIPAKQLGELNRMLSLDVPVLKAGSDNSLRAGIGLMNVNQRLKLFFGKQYGIHFKDCIEGTRIEMIFQAILKEE